MDGTGYAPIDHNDHEDCNCDDDEDLNGDVEDWNGDDDADY